MEALSKASINPTMVSSEQEARALLSKENDLEENKEILGEITVDKVAEVEKKRVAGIEKLRKKLVMALINPQMEQLEEAKVVSIALLDEEKELEDAEAMGEAIDDRVAEIHKQIMGSEAKFEILQEHSESPHDRPVKVSSSTSHSPSPREPMLSTPAMRTIMSTSKISTPTAGSKGSFAQDFASLENQEEGKVLLPEDLSSIIREGLHLRKQLYEKLVPKTTIHPAHVEFLRRKAVKLALSSDLPSTTRTPYQPASSVSTSSTSRASSPRTAATEGSRAPLSTDTLHTLKPSMATSVMTSASMSMMSKDSLPQSTKSPSKATVVSSPVPSTVAPSATSKKPSLARSSPNAFETFQAVPLPSKVPPTSGALSGLLINFFISFKHFIVLSHRTLILTT